MRRILEARGRLHRKTRLGQQEIPQKKGRHGIGLSLLVRTRLPTAMSHSDLSVSGRRATAVKVYIPKKIS